MEVEGVINTTGLRRRRPDEAGPEGGQRRRESPPPDGGTATRRNNHHPQQENNNNTIRHHHHHPHEQQHDDFDSYSSRMSRMYCLLSALGAILAIITASSTSSSFSLAKTTTITATSPSLKGRTTTLSAAAAADATGATAMDATASSSPTSSTSNGARGSVFFEKSTTDYYFSSPSSSSLMNNYKNNNNNDHSLLHSSLASSSSSTSTTLHLAAATTTGLDQQQQQQQIVAKHDGTSEKGAKASKSVASSSSSSSWLSWFSNDGNNNTSSTSSTGTEPVTTTTTHPSHVPSTTANPKAAPPEKRSTWLQRWIPFLSSSSSSPTTSSSSSAHDENAEQLLLLQQHQRQKQQQQLLEFEKHKKWHDSLPLFVRVPLHYLTMATTTTMTTTPTDSASRSSPSDSTSSSLLDSSISSIPVFGFWSSWLDPTLLRPSPTTLTDLIDKILTSTPRLLAIANLLLAATYLLHSAVANFFLSTSGSNTATAGADNNNNLPTAPTTTTGIPSTAAARDQRLGGFLVFKLLLVSAVVAPDTLDLLILLSWYTLLSFLRSLTYLCATSTQHTSQSGQPPSKGVWQLLWVVCFANLAAATICVLLFHGAGWGMILLLTSDNALLLLDVVLHLLQHFVQVLELQHAESIAVLETEQTEQAHSLLLYSEQQPNESHRDTTTSQSFSSSNIGSGTSTAHGSTTIEGAASADSFVFAPSSSSDTTFDDTRDLDRRMERLEQQHLRRLSILDTCIFALQLLTHALTVCHFLHIWSLHGIQFTLIDGVLALHLHSALTSISKKISERRNLYRIARDLDGMFENATELELRKAAAAGDVCCICLGGMSITAGNVKKVKCGHLYHTSCLREVVERARSMEAARCPLCRASVTDGRHQNNNTNNNSHNNNNDMNNQQQQQTTDNNAVHAIPPPLQQRERALFRFSTEEVFPAWLPLPAFSFEVVRRTTVPVTPQQQQAPNQPQQQQQEQLPEGNDQQQQQQPQPSLLRRLLIFAGAIPMSAEEEAAALDHLVDMFPQYDRSDLLRELRSSGSAGAVAEIILAGAFRGLPRRAGAEEGVARPITTQAAGDVAGVVVVATTE